ncbi:MAG TPA: hypothetical protein VJR89_41350 [Polyangiales bacterium]|nr:hypothetical protein [Polyangiales bacterium]
MSQIRFISILVACLVVTGLGVAPVVHAEQARDWMVAAQPGGTYLNLDVVFPGVQAMLEHRMPIYGAANELDFKVSALPTLVFVETQADVDVRLLVLSLGATVGAREIFHSLEFQRGVPIDSQARRDMEFGAGFRNSFHGYGEGRATLSLPFNDNLVFLSVNALRYEGGPDRVFDWRLGIMRDSGPLFRSDTTLFIKGRSFGAIGPRVQFLNYKLDGITNNQINYGFTFTTRPGFRKRNDIFFLSVLLGLSGTVATAEGSVRTADIYGNHIFKVPVVFEIAYRTVLDIGGSEKAVEDESAPNQ